jgi:hypothetical protein
MQEHCDSNGHDTHLMNIDGNQLHDMARHQEQTYAINNDDEYTFRFGASMMSESRSVSVIYHSSHLESLFTKQNKKTNE